VQGDDVASAEHAWLKSMERCSHFSLTYRHRRIDDKTKLY